MIRSSQIDMITPETKNGNGHKEIGMDEKSKKSVYISKRIENEIIRRCLNEDRQFSPTLDRDLSRYYISIELTKQEVEDLLTEKELSDIIEISTFFDQKELINSMPVSMLRQFTVNQLEGNINKRLFDKVADMNDLQFLALIDTIELERLGRIKKKNKKTT